MSDVTEGGEEVTPPPVASAVDEVQHKRKRLTKKRKEQEDRAFFALVMQNEAGRRFLWSILHECHTFETMFPAGPVGFPDPLAAWFQRGMQDVGQRLYQTWHVRAPAETMAMLLENDPRFQKVEL